MSDGRVSYKGIVHVSKKGDYEGMLSKTELQELTELVTDKELNICALKDEYAANGNVDFPSVFISTGYGCNKTINDHGNDEPVALTKLEEYLDKLSNNLKLTVVKVQSE